MFWSESSHYFGANSPVRNFERNVPEESSREELVLERTVPEPVKGVIAENFNVVSLKFQCRVPDNNAYRAVRILYANHLQQSEFL